MKDPIHLEVMNRPFLLPFSHEKIYEAEIRPENESAVANQTTPSAPDTGNRKDMGCVGKVEKHLIYVTHKRISLQPP